MTSKERLVAALERKVPDRLPVTTHHLQKYHLDACCGGISNDEFFDLFGLDPILWFMAHKPDGTRGDDYDPTQRVAGLPAGLPRRIVSDTWRVETKDIPGREYVSTRIYFLTPLKTLTMVVQNTGTTDWVAERLVKEKADIDIIARFATAPLCDVEAVNRAADAYSRRGMVRGHICGFDGYGQSGCWQDAACLFGIQELIMATYDDPIWVREFLGILQRRKAVFTASMKGARFDLVEHGGGDASSTVISPRILENFVVPFDAPLIALAHEAGQRVVYHTCGGMMPVLEMIADMGPDAMETFTPPAMGGDIKLAEAKRRIGGRVCMIGGFDQFHFFKGCAPADTRRAVRRCFEEAGAGGGYILCPSDHFFEAEPELLRTYADEARRCVY